MKEMIYDREAFCVLDEGSFLGYDYVIISYGTHPCAYVRIPENHPLYEVDYMDYTSEYDVDCHGGITYTNDGLYRNRPFVEKDGWWIGWDYNHIDNYNATLASYDGFNWQDKKWTTEEILQEVAHVCKQLRDME